MDGILAICLIISLSFNLIGIIITCHADKEAKRAKANHKETQNSITQLKNKIAVLEREKATLQTRVDRGYREISHLKDSLAESERKLTFYNNIRASSTKLNVPNTPVLGEHAQLDPEQASVCNEMESSFNNFFITGKAGTGKSFLLESFIKTTNKSHITLAPTGIAALKVGGVTLHSAFGYYNLVNLGIDEISSDTIRLNSEKVMVLRHVSTIIIDEISMVRADTLDKIDRILQVVTGNNQPFGAKQLLLFGDLFQLPPIAQAKEREFLLDRYGGVHFFFSNAYISSNFHFRELTMNHRQKEDASYFELLNRVRDGSVTAADIETLNARITKDVCVYDSITTLLPTKAEVDQLNKLRIRQLDSEEYIYHARIIEDKYPNKTHALESIFPIASTLHLKKGTLIMMVVNDPARRWVNGSLGIINELSDNNISVAINGYIYDIFPATFSEQEATYEDGKLVYKDILKISQYPIIPAYAITIHKAQGQTYQNIVCNLDRCFAAGQAYVALSRCSSLNGLHLTQEIHPGNIRVNKSVLDYYRKNTSQDISANS